MLPWNYISLFSILNLFAGVTGNRNVSSHDRSDRIVGGSIAKPGEYPYQVSIEMEGPSKFAHACGGSLIKPDIVLTAAHCMKVWPLYVAAGSNKVNLPNEYNNRIKVKSYIKGDYKVNIKRNDVAVLKLSRPFTLSRNMNSTIGLVKLPPKDYQAKGYCTITGWGTIKYGVNMISDDLRTAEVKIIEQEECRRRMNKVKIIYDVMVCAAEEGRDACQGDSGGPMVCTGEDKERYVAGITSFGKGCADPKYPGVYTNVAKYREWIDEAIKTLENED